MQLNSDLFGLNHTTGEHRIVFNTKITDQHFFEIILFSYSFDCNNNKHIQFLKSISIITSSVRESYLARSFFLQCDIPK